MNSLFVVAVVLATIGSLWAEVFHIESSLGKYKLKGVEDAAEACRQNGYKIASHQDVKDAFELEQYDKCACSWVSDGKVVLPIVTPRSGCFTTAAVHQCPKNPAEWKNTGWDAFCVRDNKDVSCPGLSVRGAQLYDFTNQVNDYANLFRDYTFRQDGVVRGWEFYSKRSHAPVYVAVWRPVEGNKIQAVGAVKLVATKNVNQISLTEREEIQVRRGDFIGIHYETIMHTGDDNRLPLPIADSEGGLCAGSGETERCIDSEDTYETYVIHRHHEQLFHQEGYVLNLDSLGKDMTVRQRMPALRPIFCPNEVPTRPPLPTPEAQIVTEAGSKAESPLGDISSCTFPFTYYSETFYACTDINGGGRFWCATTDQYDGINWRWCNEGDLYIEDIPCHFPFKYSGNDYNQCTNVDSVWNHPWCSITPEYSRFGWRHCNKKEVEDMSTAAPETTTTAAPETTTTAAPETTTTAATETTTTAAPETTTTAAPETTTTAAPETTTTAAPETTTTAAPETTTTAAPETTTTEAPETTTPGEGEGRPDGRAEPQPDSVPCYFPFRYKDKTYHACTDYLSNEGFWCSTEETYDGSHWRNCLDTDRHLEDMNCHFPFKYFDKEFNNCISANATKPWCSVIPEYDGVNWRTCTEKDGSATNRECVYPFLYNGQKYDMCIKAGSAKYWCSTTPEYNEFTWRDCRSDDRIPSNMPCHYPFKQSGKEFSTCTTEGAQRHWCAVEAEYNELNWRYCKDGDVFPEETPCHLPFDYLGQESKSCRWDNSVTPWCSLIPTYNPASDWKTCRQVSLTYLAGEATSLREEAQTKCEAKSLTLATKHDAQAAFEMGQESCACGWLSDGSKVELVNNPRADCSEGSQFGLNECSAETAIPICVDDRI